jgi:hypothetical protein
MKKTITLCLALAFTISAFSQEFLGVKVEGTKDEIQKKFSEKGFKFVSYKDNYLQLKGNVGSNEVEFNVIFTPKTKIAWKFVVYLPEQSSWYSLKSQYNEYLNMLKSKYGEPKSSYNFFSSPYSEGDGYEMTGVEVDKCVYAAYWEDKYSIEISKFKQVKIAYENPINAEIFSKEKKEIQTNTF